MVECGTLVFVHTDRTKYAIVDHIHSSLSLFIRMNIFKIYSRIGDNN